MTDERGVPWVTGAEARCRAQMYFAVVLLYLLEGLYTSISYTLVHMHRVQCCSISSSHDEQNSFSQSEGQNAQYEQ
jgi:hypothetical protein